ncbi:cell wall hydrolase [Neobacillus ginsengisoli]|uniref:N-acetylmuramoyl-L-alanine amidase n=1 Tax=Neobacillus ginsengisoli TaxID=904295 RepID=A0ABT9Y0Y3_9BACI|nr:cell wall hydrolase [Neobacillus ginsengisoli]MDQ0201180.1 N-acetylmuramoyl-L-alanine amidase [Neobacillus ginsengisoli]
MNNRYIKTLIVTFAAATAMVFIFIGLQNNKAEAQTEGDRLWKLGQQNRVAIKEIKPENNLHNEWNYIGEMLRIPKKTKKLAVQPSKNVMGIEGKTKGLSVQSLKPAMERPEKERAEPAVSNEEKDLFARLVEAEAKGESYKGKVAVATVVLNRVDSPKFPDTITDVIKQVVGGSYAFSPVQNGEINKPASDEAKRAVDEALTRNDRLNDSIYFYNPDIATDKWIRTRHVVMTIGHHVFAK